MVKLNYMQPFLLKGRQTDGVLTFGNDIIMCLQRQMKKLYFKHTIPRGGYVHAAAIWWRVPRT